MVRRKIELFMVLFLLIGAIVASWKLSEMTASVSKKDAKAKKVPVYPEKNIEMCNKKCYF